MLDAGIQLSELATLIENKRGKKQRADYFQSVFENLFNNKANKDDVTTVRFGLTGDAYAPNYQVVRNFDGFSRLYWGTYHRTCDEDFPNGWNPANLTKQAFTLEDLNAYRHA